MQSFRQKLSELSNYFFSNSTVVQKISIPAPSSRGPEDLFSPKPIKRAEHKDERKIADDKKGNAEELFSPRRTKHLKKASSSTATVKLSTPPKPRSKSLASMKIAPTVSEERKIVISPNRNSVWGNVSPLVSTSFQITPVINPNPAPMSPPYLTPTGMAFGEDKDSILTSPSSLTPGAIAFGEKKGFHHPFSPQDLIDSNMSQALKKYIGMEKGTPDLDHLANIVRRHDPSEELLQSICLYLLGKEEFRIFCIAQNKDLHNEIYGLLNAVRSLLSVQEQRPQRPSM